MALVVHPHFHSRHTGVTTHTASVLAPLSGANEVRWTGQLLPDTNKRISVGEVLARARTERVVWHAHRNNELLLGVLLRLLRKNLKLVFTRHGSGKPGAWTRWLARRADALVMLNDHNGAWFDQPSTVVGHGVDLSRFSPPPDREAAWRALGVGGRFGIGVVGRVRENKGHGDFAAAVKPLLTEDWRAVCVGKVDEPAWANQLGLHLTGEHRDVERWYQGLSILVNPSHAESFGLTILEGMASGCCVVASKLEHVPKLIEHGRTGLLYPPGDVKALREVLEPLLREPERAAKLGAAAAEEARARFGIEHEAKRLTELYARL